MKKMTLPEVIRQAHALAHPTHVVIMRESKDFQVRLSTRGFVREGDDPAEMGAEMRYVDRDSKKPECDWFTFEGFSVASVLADDWQIVTSSLEGIDEG